MKVGTNEFYTSGGYLKNNPSWGFEDAKMKSILIDKIITRNGLHPLDVVETGCGAGGNLYEWSKLNPKIKTFKGYDISPQAIGLAKQFENERIKFYCEDFLFLDTAPADFLLMIDVLEHIDDYIGFLQKLKNKSNYFVFHVPLDLCCRTIFKPHVLYQQRTSVGHIHYFTKDIIEWAIVDAGYEIIDQFYTKPVADTEASKSPKHLLKKAMRNFSFLINPDWSAKYWGGYSIMFLLK